jgi:hypothetical protein
MDALKMSLKGFYILLSSNKKGERMIPSNFLPYMLFSPQTP